jgi:hypothetical protein
VAAIAAALLASPQAAGAELPARQVVVIVLAPYLTWTDLLDSTAPTLSSLADKAAIGGANVRAGSLDRSPDGQYGAGVLSAGRALTSAEASRVVPGAPFGALGDAVRRAGGATVAIGTSAPDLKSASDPKHAPALVVAADSSGTADLVRCDGRLLREAGGAPPTVRADLAALGRAYLDVTTKKRPLLVVIDPGEGERARIRAGNDPTSWAQERAAAVRTLDEAVGRLLRRLPESAALIVVSTADYRGGDAPGFGPVILYGAGPGVLTSESTRRDGVVTLPDVTATVLALLGLERPAGMTGRPLSVTDADRGGDARIGAMEGLDARARALEALREPLWNGFIAACVVALAVALGLILGAPPGTSATFRAPVGYVLIGLLSVVPGSLLAVIPGRPATPTAAWIGLVAGVVATLLVVFSWPRRDASHALVRLTFLTTALIIGDQVLGGRLAYGTPFSYSPLFGARFFGLGNEAAAVLFGALLVMIGWRVDHYGQNRAKGFLITGGAAVVVAVLPVLGANLGVAAWGSVAVVAAYLWASGRRVTWRTFALLAVALTALLALAVASELLGGGSHLGGLLEALRAGGAGVAALMQRKIEIGLGIARATPLVALLPVSIAVLAWVLVTRPGRLGAILGRERGLAAAHVGALAGSVVALVTEDSGVVIAALLLLYVLAALGISGLEEEASAG